MNKFLLSLFLMSVSFGALSAEFKYDSYGYLMEACEQALNDKNTFESGYCRGVYSAVISTKMNTYRYMSENKWCPDNNAMNEKNAIGIVVKWLKNNRDKWVPAPAPIVFEQALAEAYPCKSR